MTRNGRREAVLLGADDYDALIETLAILGDSETAAAIKDALNEITRGETSTAEDVREAMIRAGQLAE